MHTDHEVQMQASRSSSAVILLTWSLPVCKVLVFDMRNPGRQAWGLLGVCRAQGCMRASPGCAAGTGN